VPPYPRLILIEVPGGEVPASLKGDIEYVIPKLPNVEELKQELDVFVKEQNITLEGNGENKHAIAQSLAGLPRHTAAKMLARCWVELKKLDPAWLRTAKAERITETLGGALSFVDMESPDVGGQENLVAWLKTRGAAFASKKAKDYGLPEIKGLLVTGIPGTGKSLFVRYTERTIKLPLLRLDVGKLFGSLVGQSESQVRQAIEAAEACAPCVLWIDEIEKGMAGMKGGGGDSGTSQRVFGTILTWLQEKTKPVFVVATANRVFDLPPELLRKGRFDEIFFVDLPSEQEREDIARIHVLRRDRDVKILDPKAIAAGTAGFSGAEIEQAIVDGMFTAYAEDREVTLADILLAASSTMPLSKTMSEDISKLRQWAKGRARMAGKAEVVKDAGTIQRPSMELKDF
jgi:SpoVK/Ycf46/Vps4 family AAA+-type ATPase